MDTTTFVADAVGTTPAGTTPLPLGAPQSMEDLTKHPSFLVMPRVGSLVSGTVISVGKNEVYIDLDGLRTGVARAKEIADESGTFANLKIGDRVEATVIELENELGIVELSFRTAGHRKAWEHLEALRVSGETVSVKVLGANKGGLLVELERITGFLPVSQLSQEHYPRIPGGDKQKILEKLQTFIGTTMEAKVLDVAEAEGKLIVSEKRVVSQKQEDTLAQYHIGNTVEGTVSGITPFGAFVRFGDGLEGLIHISELAWQRIDNPVDVVKTGETVTAKIIGLDNGKISLSRKQLIEDPWMHVGDRYHVGQRVKGKILKTNPFGMFVELDPDIHGLAHISEFSGTHAPDGAAPATIGDVLEFQIISLDPMHHRLGLSRRAVTMEDEAIAAVELPSPAEQTTSAPETPAATTEEQQTETPTPTPTTPQE